MEWILLFAASAIGIAAFSSIGSKLVRKFAESVFKSAKSIAKSLSKAIVVVAKNTAIVAIAAAAGVKFALASKIVLGVGLINKVGNIVKAENKGIQSLREIKDTAIENAVENYGKYVAEIAL